MEIPFMDEVSSEKQLIKWVGIFQVGISWVENFQCQFSKGEFDGWEISTGEFSRGKFF